MGKFEDDLAALKATVVTASAVISQLQTAISGTKNKNSDSNSAEDIDALKLAQDSAALIRAHSTKISLLIINKPFTATAVATVLRELVAGPLPGLASAVQLCNAARYTKAMSDELQWRAKKVFSEFATLVEAIPLDGKVLSNDKKNGTGSTAGKGSLASTGVVWEACDTVIELEKIGVAGLMIKKAEEYRDLLKDAVEELQEWGDEVSDDEDNDEGSADDSDGDDTHKDAQDTMDDMFGSQAHIPSNDPGKIRPRLESTLKRLRLIILMYQALVKRRLKIIPDLRSNVQLEAGSIAMKTPEIIKCLDTAMNLLNKIPDITDELASSFYELDGEEIDQRIEECVGTGVEVANLLSKNWKGGEDEFTTWSQKFQVTIQKGQ